jgi:segregation and condensation protein A
MPIAPYELKTPEFVGPIEKLLELIEAKKLDSTRLSLSVVTADFLSYLQGLSEISPALLADFIVVASRLLLIKSKALLPEATLSEEEEHDIQDLEARLALYREFKAAAEHLSARVKKHLGLYARDYFLLPQGQIVVLPVGVTPQTLEARLAELMRALEAISMRERSITRKAVISIEEKMRALVTHLETVSRSKLTDLAETREETIALFLAVLHLLKDQLIEIEQAENFHDIIITPRVPHADTH